MKKALVIASTAGFLRGFLLHDMKLLQQLGYEVHCAADGRNHSFDPVALFSELSIPFHQIDISPRSPLSRDTLRTAAQFRALQASQKFEVIHCHTPVIGAIVRILGLPSRLFRKCKIIYTTHGLAFPKGCPTKDRILYGSIEWLCGHLCDGVITINYEDFRTMKSFGCKSVYHINGVGVNTSRFHNAQIDRTAYRKSIGVSENDIMVLAVGELSARKNQAVILRALALLEDPRYVLVICGKALVGEGTYDYLKHLAEELGVRVAFLGFRRDIPQINKCADIAVIPSLREGLGLAGVEALASGVPVVGSAVQGIKDYIIDGETGFLCEPKDADEFAQHIRELSDPELRERMKQRCIEKAEEFRAEVSNEQMRDIYRELLTNS